MRLVLHVGMGKSGSTSIQHALRSHHGELASQGVEFLGMWLDGIDPTYRGFMQQEKLWALPEPDRREAGAKLAGFMADRRRETGVETFILSNESWSGQALGLRPIIDQVISAGICVSVIAFVRDPATWLPSAHVQWGVRNKMNKGAILHYEESARRLVKWYSGIIEWAEEMPDHFTAFSYDRSSDVVQAFATAAGVALGKPQRRMMERSEGAEILMRALFNHRFEEAELPTAFNEVAFSTAAAIPTLDSIAARCLDYSRTGAVIEDNADFFDAMAKKIGFDVRGTGGAPPAMADMTAVRERLLDCLIEMAFRQGLRIKAMEERLALLDAPPDNPTTG